MSEKVERKYVECRENVWEKTESEIFSLWEIWEDYIICIEYRFYPLNDYATVMDSVRSVVAALA